MLPGVVTESSVAVCIQLSSSTLLLQWLLTFKVVADAPLADLWHAVCVGNDRPTAPMVDNKYQ